MKSMFSRAAAAALLLVAAGCDQAPTAPAEPAVAVEPITFLIDPNTDVPGGNLHPEAVFVCKDVVDDPATTSFDFTATSTRNDLNTWVPAFSLTNGQCRMIARAGGALFSVTATETAAPGFVLDSIVRYNATFASGAQPFVISVLDKQVLSSGETSATAQASGSASVGNVLRGGLIIFYNSAEPPDNGGGQGCTPGYWKQTQHFGNWTAPYTPTTLFGSVFANAFPNKTLLDVVSLGGGGLNALGRHTVAALLNAANGSVSSGLTTAQVIAAFNAAYASGSYDAQKNIFEGLNEQGCPLDRAE